MEITEPSTNLPYLLYVPSTYSSERAWPLVIACHGTWPYDTETLQMKEWAKFAENQGIIVAAPNLAGTKGDFPPSPDKQIELQRQDEKAILSMVAAIKRTYHVAEEQVFLTGWSAGAYTILHVGLNHPDIFRAMAVRQGSFDERFMDVSTDRLDRWQQILAIYGKADFLRDQSKAMIKWLRSQKMYVEEREITGSHRRINPKLPWTFFRDVARKNPWVRIRTVSPDPTQPLSTRFLLDAIPPAKRQKWFFGDGEESYDASPIHTYKKPGRYKVTVNVALKGGKKYSRSSFIRVGVPPKTNE